MPHIHEKVDFTVEVFIVHESRVLLRKHDKYKIWLSVGGHIELDEDPNQAALREVREEVGLDVTLAHPPLLETESSERYKELIPPRFLNRHRINDEHEHVCLTYFAKADTDVTINQEEELSEGMQWFTMEELDNPELTPGVRAYAKQALKELSKA